VYITNKGPPRLPEMSPKTGKPFSKTFLDFVAQCLTVNQEERPSARDLLYHPFIKKTKGGAVQPSAARKIHRVHQTTER